MADVEELKRQIDEMSYEELLRRWRYAPAGDLFFAGPVGQYYSRVMAEKKIAIGHAAAVAISKGLG